MQSCKGCPHCRHRPAFLLFSNLPGVSGPLNGILFSGSVWIKYVRRLQPYQEPSYQLLHDYIANSGGSSTGSTALWDTRDDWKLTRNSHKRAAAESTHKGGFDLFEHESSSDEKDVEEEEVEAAHYQQLRHACKKQKLDLEILSTQPEA
eukprot:scaffold227504_cov18-Tisochrysis_lutea.AAC.1